MPILAEKLILGVFGNAITNRESQWYTHHSFGRIVEQLAPRVRQLHYFAPQSPCDMTATCDYPLAEKNVTVHPWPVQRNSLQALKRPDRLLRHYWQMARTCDAFFLRGSQPLIWCMHILAAMFGKPVVHWIVGNPLAIMQSEDRGYGSILRYAGICFARLERFMTRTAMWLSKSHVIANGEELGAIFRSKRTHIVVSTSISREDFLVRDDTCGDDTIRLVFVGMIRPEKGLEYLIRAIPMIDSTKEVHLSIVGSWEQFTHEYHRLTNIIQELNLTSRIHWEGYASYGQELFDQLDRSDILILPSISEGTPRVLVEARARSLPIVSTRVGGIPSSVMHEVDGLLVPPRDSHAIAQAVSKIILDHKLRRNLILQGRNRTQNLTVERFVELIITCLIGGTVSEGLFMPPADIQAESITGP